MAYFPWCTLEEVLHGILPLVYSCTLQRTRWHIARQIPRSILLAALSDILPFPWSRTDLRARSCSGSPSPSCKRCCTPLCTRPAARRHTPVRWSWYIVETPRPATPDDKIASRWESILTRQEPQSRPSI